MESSFSPQTARSRGLGTAAVVAVALGAALVGIIVASSLDFTQPTVAMVPPVINATPGYPLVERDGDYESPFVSVVERVKDAVVNVSARTREEQPRPWWHYGRGYSTSSGSGFFFRDDGYILTNNHVVENAVKLVVRTATGYKYDAELIGTDPATDLAVLKVTLEEEITAIPFGDSDELKVGDWAIAIGNPFPQQGLDRTVTVGVISAKGRSNLRFGSGETPSYQDYIQTDASINPGNSGGPLLNLKGEAIGVNAAIYGPTGSSVGIGFAIPINLARAVVPDLITSGKVSRGWLGVWLGELTEREAKRQGLEAVKGVRIDSVFAGSPAQRSGIKSGDIVVGFNNHPVENASQFSVLVSTARGGEVVAIDVMREGDRLTLRTQVVDRDAFLSSIDRAEPATEETDFRSIQWLGMEIISFTKDVARALSIDHEVDGVYVRRVYAGSSADRASITRGTIILQVNNEPVRSLDELRAMIGDLDRSRERIPLIVQEPDGAVARKVVRP